jgi:hypothetical protein
MRAAGAPAAMLALLKDTDVMPGAITMAAGVEAKNWTEYYMGVIHNLKPGLTELIVHLAYDDAEMQAITEEHPAYGSAWRQRDFDVITSPGFRQALKDNSVTLIGWKDIKERGSRH